MTLSYVSYSQLIQDTLEVCHNFTGLTRKHLLGVVGIPKSGMIPAQIIASRMSLPLSDLETFLNTGGRFYPNRGGRSCQYWEDPLCDSISRGIVLFVDDSIHEGSTLREVDAELHRCSAVTHQGSYSIIAIYGTGHCKEFHYHKEVPLPRLFEWNWIKHPVLEQSILDMDGIICHNWTGPRDDEEETIKRYEHWLENVQPLYLPTRKVRAIVSARIEKYRPQTEGWLARWGVRYENLYLSQRSMAELRRDNSHWKHKADHYAASASPLFIESDKDQAQKIAKATGKSVFCPSGPGSNRILGEVGEVYSG